MSEKPIKDEPEDNPYQPPAQPPAKVNPKSIILQVLFWIALPFGVLFALFIAMCVICVFSNFH